MTQQRRTTERDGAGFPVGDLSPQLQRIRKEEQENAKARAAIVQRKMRRPLEEIRQDAIDRMQREEQARHDLEEHLRLLADEIDEEAARTQPNPWLRPWDPGYESPTLLALRQAAEGRPAGPVDIDVIRQKMQSRLAEIRRRNPSRGVPGERAAGPAGGRKPFMQWLAEMSPQEVAALPPQKREMRRRLLEGDPTSVLGKGGSVARTGNANWRLS